MGAARRHRGTVEQALCLDHRMIDTASDDGTQRGLGHALHQSESSREGPLRARAEGLARNLGVNHYTINQTQALIGSSCLAPVVTPIEWSPFGHRHEMMQFYRNQQIVLQT